MRKAHDNTTPNQNLRMEERSQKQGNLINDYPLSIINYQLIGFEKSPVKEV